MHDAQTCRRRAAEFEADAQQVTGANRRRYLDLAECWRELAASMERQAPRELAA
ncbi:hypothetical protein [Phenylobacterium sp.]|uniref:hypothetical protein n=1 Tax=Phenylobacterium sp. TaxID=1871053 RepID=UPI0035B4B39E